MDAHMPRYSAERKAAILNKLLPSHNRSVVLVSAEEGISDVTLYSWKDAVKKARSLVRRNPGRRGQLTSLGECTRLLQYCDEAVAGGAARPKAAELMGLSGGTVTRWRQADVVVTPDRRPLAKQTEQSHQLRVAEEVAILAACNQQEYRSLPPSQIVPQLSDKGIYLASESSFYRGL